MLLLILYRFWRLPIFGSGDDFRLVTAFITIDFSQLRIIIIIAFASWLLAFHFFLSSSGRGAKRHHVGSFPSTAWVAQGLGDPLGSLSQSAFIAEPHP